MSKKISTCMLCDYSGNMKIKSVKEKRPIIQCPKCSFQFMDPFPTADEIEKIYSQDYFASWGIGDGETKEVAEMKKSTFRHILKGILPYVNSGKILDVGTATGFLLEEAQKIGFDVYGVEISEYASSIAKSKFGADRIYNGILQEVTFEKASFDLLTMCDVIEHVSDPIDLMISANKLIKNVDNSNGGVLADNNS